MRGRGSAAWSCLILPPLRPNTVSFPARLVPGHRSTVCSCASSWHRGAPRAGPGCRGAHLGTCAARGLPGRVTVTGRAAECAPANAESVGPSPR